MSKCKDCPLAGIEGRSCLAQTTNHTRYCDLVDPCHADYDPRYIPILLRDGKPESPETDPPAVAETLALIARMKACPNWQASSSCGCGNNRCLAEKGRQGIVSHQDCFDCLRETIAPTADRSEPSGTDS